MNFEILLSDHDIHVLSVGLNSLLKEDIFLFPEEEKQLILFQNDKRKNEFLGARKLRNELLIKSSIAYNEIGKPFLIDDPQTAISISHTKDLVIMGKAPFEIGLDVEIAQEKIIKIIDKFASEHEKNLYPLAQFNLIEWYTFIWCAKEAIYKLGQVKGLSFKEEIFIEKIETATHDFLQLTAVTNPNKNIEGAITVYCFKSENYLFAVARFKD
jgi:4'-phosphopantetheinyl transferase EntD